MRLVGRVVCQWALVTAIVASLAGAAGCGSSAGAGNGTPKTPQEMLVRETEIRDAGAGTPKATLLAWWQALQFDDASTASGYYAPGVTSEPRIAAQLRVAGAPTLAKPEVEQVRVDHGRALVYAIVVSATVTKSNRLDTFSRHPVTFHMVRHGSDWAFVDNDFLAERAAAAMAYQSGSQK